MAWVFDHSQATLGTRLVALSVANHADKTGRNAWAAVATYAEEAHLSKRQAQYALRTLEAAGELRKTGTHGPRADRQTAVWEFPGMADVVQHPHPAPAADGVQSSTERGAESGAHGVQPIAPKPSITIHEPSKEHSLPLVEARFDEFYAVYPRKVGRPKAFAAFAAAVKRGASPLAIIHGAERFRTDPNRVDEFTPYPTTWLHREGWNDPPLPARNGNGRGSAAGRTHALAQSMRERGL
ncbi:MAG: hypothetical protein ACRDH7_07550 [Actinomycetota bacterium]